jgi:hypothetical protein
MFASTRLNPPQLEENSNHNNNHVRYPGIITNSQWTQVALIAIVNPHSPRK